MTCTIYRGPLEEINHQNFPSSSTNELCHTFAEKLSACQSDNFAIPCSGIDIWKYLPRVAQLVKQSRKTSDLRKAFVRTRRVISGRLCANPCPRERGVS